MNTMTANQIREICKTWEGRAESIQSLLDADDLPSFLKTDPKMQELGVAGCWLAERLVADFGVTVRKARKQQFVLGQYAVFGDVYEHTARIYNEFAAGAAPQQPGNELANAINRAGLKKVEAGLEIKRVDERVATLRTAGNLKKITSELAKGDKEARPRRRVRRK